MPKTRWLVLGTALSLLLGGCPPEEPPTGIGELGQLQFLVGTFSDAQGVVFAANGTRARLEVATLDGEPLPLDLTLISSDPTVIATTPDGQITSGVAGTATISAMTEADGEIDRVTLTVENVDRVEVRSVGSEMAALLVGHEHAFLIRHYGTSGRELYGEVSAEIEADELLELREPGPTEGLRGIFVSGIAPGTGTLTVQSGEVVERATVEIVAPEDVTGITFGAPSRSGSSNDGRVAVRVFTEAFTTSRPVAGAHCTWEVSGDTTVGLDNLQPNGSLTTDFWSSEERFTATCRIGSTSETLEVVVADVL